MKKFELSTGDRINWFGRTLYRIKACMDFTTASGKEVKAGDLGGYVEREQNLSQQGKAWIYGNAKVWGNAEVHGNAEIWGSAKVYGNVRVYGNAKVYGNAEIWDNAKVWGSAEVYGNAEVWGNAKVYGNVRVYGNAKVYGNAEIWDNAKVWGSAEVYGNAKVWGSAEVYGNASISSTKHIFYITPIGKYADSLTVCRTKKRELQVCFNFQTYDVEEFRGVIRDWDKEYADIAEGALELAKKHIDLT